uniref:amidophosphoribosyltransferase n=1 Tax=Marseillevirus LCMAC202 TaxID=2506606 RepID=A0A481YZC5_9VIRU|nr:MAG: phosphoribosyl transferase [Marseillevirus LCMAC202]
MCGIFAVYSQEDTGIARKIFFALMALQHRGQEAAGIAVSDGRTINYKKDSGMVNQIFRERHLAKLPGRFGIGHTRYSTTKNKSGGRQPYQFASKLGPFAIAHNGEITNYNKTKQKLLDKGVCFFTETDTELLAHYIARTKKDTWEEALADVIKEVPGAYSLVVLTNNEVWALRDPLGMRLMCVGKKDNDWFIASESCCLNVVDATFVSDVEPGSLVKISKDGYSQRTVHQYPRKTCAFEHVYFSRPDSQIDGMYVNEIRQNIGEHLWGMTRKQFQPKNDYIVAGVPESATPMAVGFANASGIKYNEIFAKNRYIHRTFIKPIDTERKSAVYLKFNPLVNNICGKKIILVDDSIVRGHTIRHLVQIVRKAGAKEIHILIGSPEIHHPCYMGIDMKSENEFIMNTFNPAELAMEIGADSITFLELDKLRDAIGKKGLCTACWTGEYPKELEW